MEKEALVVCYTQVTCINLQVAKIGGNSQIYLTWVGETMCTCARFAHDIVKIYKQLLKSKLTKHESTIKTILE